MSRFTPVLATGLAAVTALTLSACGSGEATAAAGTAEDPVRIGVVNSGDDYWNTFTDLAEEEGISVELVNFSTYQLPNQGLTDGDLDLNQFQHLQFLAGYNTASGQDLTPIAATAVYPLGLYSLKHGSVEDIPQGGEVAIPNDQPGPGAARAPRGRADRPA
jgi:D-methionine transport system substrate-binding protein